MNFGPASTGTESTVSFHHAPARSASPFSTPERFRTADCTACFCSARKEKRTAESENSTRKWSTKSTPATSSCWEHLPGESSKSRRTECSYRQLPVNPAGCHSGGGRVLVDLSNSVWLSAHWLGDCSTWTAATQLPNSSNITDLPTRPPRICSNTWKLKSKRPAKFPATGRSLSKQVSMKSETGETSSCRHSVPAFTRRWRRPSSVACEKRRTVKSMSCGQTKESSSAFPPPTTSPPPPCFFRQPTRSKIFSSENSATPLCSPRTFARTPRERCYCLGNGLENALRSGCSVANPPTCSPSRLAIPASR